MGHDTSNIPAADGQTLGDLRKGTAPLDRPKQIEPIPADRGETFRWKCPACGGTKVRLVIPKGEDDNMYDSRNFRVFQDRRCKECGRMWTPACPRWLAYFSAGTGALLMFGAAAVMLITVREYGAVGVLLGAVYAAFPGVCGLFPLTYGLGVLKGKLGRVTMR